MPEGWVELLPHFHASMNACAMVCQVAGWRIILRDRAAVKAHARWMVAALGFSVLFLASYLTYHTLGTSKVYEGPGRPVYLIILISHIILSIIVVPMVLRAFWLAVRERLEEHVRFARWALAVWLYVSVTGVIVYLMVFHLQRLWA